VEFERNRYHTKMKPASPIGHAIEAWIGTSLLSGVLASAAFLLAGLSWRWAATGSPQFDYVLPRTNILNFAREELILSMQGGIRPRLLLNFGLVILLFTPYMRVLLSLIYFCFIERNWKYTVFTGIVFAVLTYSLLLR
jgi:uncharacterized membrane protein